MDLSQKLILVFCWSISFGFYQNHPNFNYLPGKENFQISTDLIDRKEEMKEEEENKIDFKSEVLLKIALAVLAYKALAFTLVLFAMVVILPLLNPANYHYS